MDETGSRDLEASSVGGGRSIPVDRVLSAVAHEHRRTILRSLHDASEDRLEYDALVDRVTERVRDDDPERAVDERRQRVEIALRHNHLPKLEEARMIDYETDAGHVQSVCGEMERELLALVGSRGQRVRGER